MLTEILFFMQENDKHGEWLEWLEEIEAGESEFDKEYVIGVLMDWYTEHENEEAFAMIDKVNAL
jgi:predicted transcriptional regulator